MTKRKSLMAAAALLLGLIGCTMLSVGAELAHRYRRQGSFSLPRSQDTWVRDPELLYKLNPKNPDYPGSYRGKAPNTTPGADIHVVCMGGSTTYGHDVESNEAWPHFVEETLKARGIAAEVVNAGTPGWGSSQVLRRYRRDVAPESPDYVVLYMGWNHTGAPVPGAGWVPSGIPRPNENWLERAWTIGSHGLVRHSLLMRDIIWSLTVRGQAADRDVWSGKIDYDIFASDVREVVSEIQSHGQTALLVLQLSLLHDDMTPEEVALYQPVIWQQKNYTPDMLADINRKRSAICAVAREFDAPLVDTQASIDALTGEERISLFLDHMHLSVAGNKRVGELVGAELTRLIAAREP